MDPLGAADKLGDLAPRPGQRLGDLHAAGAAADDAPAFPLVGDAVVPLRRVECDAGKAVAAFDVGKHRAVEKAGGADEEIGNIALAAGGFDVPAPVAEARGDDLFVEADKAGEAAVARHLLDVGPDLLGRRVFA